VVQLISVFLVHLCIGNKLNFKVLFVVNIGVSVYRHLAYYLMYATNCRAFVKPTHWCGHHYNHQSSSKLFKGSEFL